MKKMNLDVMLEKGLKEEVPETVLERTNPLERAMKWILIGMFLSTFYIKPGLEIQPGVIYLVGLISMFLGFRILENENKWFRLCFYGVMALMVLDIGEMALQVTYLNQSGAGKMVLKSIHVLWQVLQIGGAFSLWKGIKSIYRHAGQTRSGSGALLLAVWYTVVTLAGRIFNLDAIFLGDAFHWIVYGGLLAVLLVSFLWILKKIHKEWRFLKEAGYVVQTTKIRIPGWCAGLLTAAVAVGVIFASYEIVGNTKPMNWQQTAEKQESSLEKIRTRLVEKGYPEELAKDLTKKDLEDMDRADRVIVKETKLQQIDVKSVYTACNENGSRWKVVTHFSMEDNFAVDGMDCIWLQWEASAMSELKRDTYRGYVFCEKDGKNYGSKLLKGQRLYDSLDQIPIFDTREELRYAFSMPKGAVKKRGYITYEVVNTDWTKQNLIWGEEWQKLEKDGEVPEQGKQTQEEIHTWIRYGHQPKKFYAKNPTVSEKIKDTGEEITEGETELKLLVKEE